MIEEKKVFINGEWVDYDISSFHIDFNRSYPDLDKGCVKYIGRSNKAKHNGCTAQYNSHSHYWKIKEGK